MILNLLERRQSYGGASSSIASAGGDIGDAASKATSSLSRPQLIGIIVAIFILTILVIGSTWWCCVRCAKRRDAANEDEARLAKERILTTEIPSSNRVNVREFIPNSRYSTRQDNEGDDDWTREPLTQLEGRDIEGSGDGVRYTQDYGHSHQSNPRYTNYPSTPL